MISISPFVDYHFSLFNDFSCKHFLLTSGIVNFIVFQSIHSSEEAELAEQCYSGLTLTGSQALSLLLAYTPHLSWKGETLGRTGMRKLVGQDKDGEIATSSSRDVSHR